MPPRVEHELEVERREVVVPEELPPEELAHEGELLGRRVASRLEHIAHHRELTFRALLEQREEEIVLALEVGVHRALGEPGCRRHLVECRAVEAVASEDDRRRVQQVLAGHGPPAIGGQRLERGTGAVGCHTHECAGYSWVCHPLSSSTTCRKRCSSAPSKTRIRTSPPPGAVVRCTPTGRSARRGSRRTGSRRPSRR